MERETLRPIAIWGNLVSFYFRGTEIELFHNVVESVNSRGRQLKVRYVKVLGGGVECCVYRLYEGEGEGEVGFTDLTILARNVNVQVRNRDRAWRNVLLVEKSCSRI